MTKILFFGDVVGKPGRQGLAQVLPMLKEEYEPDVVIANVENMAHGKGVTPSTMKELADLGINAFTSGNHVFSKGEQSAAAFAEYDNLIRPANYEGALPGHGHYRFSVSGQQILIINLNGTVFFEKQFRGEIANPFFAVDTILGNETQKDDIIVVDFHAEATSEKVAMGWHLDGRVSLVVGTHTHIPTADSRILPGGTAYVTDLGMVGPETSVLGAKIENALNPFLEKDRFSYEVAEGPEVIVNAVYVETDGAKATKIEKILKRINI
jgi:2',3'-cyclic-nucleotide 2'-phosphodiesterase